MQPGRDTPKPCTKLVTCKSEERYNRKGGTRADGKNERVLSQAWVRYKLVSGDGRQENDGRQIERDLSDEP